MRRAGLLTRLNARYRALHARWWSPYGVDELEWHSVSVRNPLEALNYGQLFCPIGVLVRFLGVILTSPHRDPKIVDDQRTPRVRPEAVRTAPPIVLCTEEAKAFDGLELLGAIDSHVRRTD